MSGAKIATPMNSKITTSPATATGRWMKRRNASCAGLRGMGERAIVHDGGRQRVNHNTLTPPAAAD